MNAPNRTPNQPDDRVFVYRWGEGPRLFVGLHGWNGNHRTFEPLVTHLPDDASLLAIDLPGYGQSPPPRSWTGPAIADQLAETLRPRLDGSFTLLGSCSGTALATYLARRLQPDIQRFVLLEPFAYVPWYLRLLLIPLLGRLFYLSAFGTASGRSIANHFLADKRDRQTDMMASFADNPIGIPYRYLALFDRLDPPGCFASLACEKVILQATDTFGAVRQSVTTWRDVWPEAELVQIEAGHLLLEEAVDQVAKNLFKTQ